MSMPGSLIVVGVDGSPRSDLALRWAVRWAERTGAVVRAVMCWEYPILLTLPSPIGQPVPPPERMQDATEQALTTVLEPVRAATTVEVDGVARRGKASTVLLEEATSAVMVVVGTRGLGRARAALLGSVSRKVAAASPCPVAVVPEETDLEATGPVVVGVDGSAGSLGALRWAGAATDGPIHAVHVFEYPFGPEYAVGEFEFDDPDDLGVKLLEQSVAEALGDRPDVRTSTSRGDARDVLADPSLEGSLIVVGTRGHTGVEGVFLGSVATDLAARSTVPVVMVPPE
jgi:nucleotide-binding universal stress UspA family protein